MRRRPRCVIGVALSCLVAVAASTPVTVSASQAEVPTAAQGFGLDDLQLAGVAQRRPNGWILLTGTHQEYAVGAAYPSEPMAVDAFTVRARFRIHGQCADGFAIVVQDDSATALGAYGGDLGYGRNAKVDLPGVTHSLAIEADLYRNSGQDEPIPSLGLQTRGVEENDADPAFSLGSAPADALAEDGVHRLRITYHDATMGVFLDGQRRLHQSVDLLDVIGAPDGTAYVGLSAGTGLCTPTISIRGFTVAS